MEEDKALVILKIVVMITFFLIVAFFGTLPIRSKNFKKRPLLRAIGATFAGCLFLNVAIMHILPEAADTLEQFLRGQHDHDHDDHQQVFPLAYLLLMVGFIITVFFTKVLSFHSHEDDHAQEINDEDEQSVDTDTSPVKIRKPESQDFQDGQKDPNIIIKSNDNLKQSLLTQGQSNKQNKIIKSKSMQPNLVQKKVKVKKSKSKAHTHGHSHGHTHSHGHAHDHNQHKHSHEKPKHQEGNTHDQEISHHAHVLQNKSMLNQAFILTAAIYFHTIFQGIAIGVQNNLTGFLSTAIAIGFHKWADALSMGCHYRNKNVSKRLSYALIIIQAFLNVFAIGLGWLISSSGEVVEAIFLSISAGTFLAISTIEMLGEQLHQKQYMVIKFCLLLGATAFVASIWFLENSIFH